MISPTAEYALRAVVAIAQANGDSAATQEIARITKVPPGYLPKVLQILGRAGLVESRRGLGGGFKLARPASELTVLDVINAVDPFKRIEKCPLGIESHGTNLCPLHQRLDEAAEHVERSFASTTISELLGQPSRSTPFCEDGKPTGLRIGNGTGAGERRAGTRRHNALIELSRDHTLGLAVAKHLVESADQQDADRAAALQELVSAWRDDLSQHFAQEEEFLLPVIVREEDARRLRTEHLALRANAELAAARLDRETVDVNWIRGVGTLLHDHIRWEERELFPAIERSAAPEQLERIAAQISQQRSSRGVAESR